MKSIVMLPVLNLNLLNNDKLKKEKVEKILFKKNIDYDKLNKYDKVFIFESNPYKSNFKIILKYFKSKNYSLVKLYKILKNNINYYNSIPKILENLDSEKVVLIEDTKDILNNM